MVQINCTTVVVFYLQMAEGMEGSGVYWYPHQRAYCSAFKNWPGYINASIDIFFNKQILASASAMGMKKTARMEAPIRHLIPLSSKLLLVSFTEYRYSMPFYRYIHTVEFRLGFTFFERLFTTAACMLNLQRSIFSGVNIF